MVDEQRQIFIVNRPFRAVEPGAGKAGPVRVFGVGMRGIGPEAGMAVPKRLDECRPAICLVPGEHLVGDVLDKDGPVFAGERVRLRDHERLKTERIVCQQAVGLVVEVADMMQGHWLPVEEAVAVEALGTVVIPEGVKRFVYVHLGLRLYTRLLRYCKNVATGRILATDLSPVRTCSTIATWI